MHSTMLALILGVAVAGAAVLPPQTVLLDKDSGSGAIVQLTIPKPWEEPLIAEPAEEESVQPKKIPIVEPPKGKPEEPSKEELRRKHNGEPKKTAPPKNFAELASQLWELDAADRAPKSAVRLNWQNKQGNRVMKPLFDFVNETLFERPIYAALVKLYKHKDLFSAPVCQEEPKLTGARRTELHNFFDVLTATPGFKLIHQYLVDRKEADSNFDKFAEVVFELWFGSYTRCRGPEGSSGFEHVFMGEKKSGIVDGHHSWVRYYLQEKAGEIEYHGYYGFEEETVGTIRYTWGRNNKRKGGFFMHSSPAFDFNLFTACTLTNDENRCNFKLERRELGIVSYTQPCHDFKKANCISTTYPIIVGV